MKGVSEKLEKLFQNQSVAENSVQLQQLWAPTLRASAIKHLAESDSPVGQGFRGEYGFTKTSRTDTYQTYLEKQAKNGTWGTDIELISLSEDYQVNVVVTSFTKGVPSEPFVLHRVDNPEAPLIHLFNVDNKHWSYNNETLGDGNCLYNAFAQALGAIHRQNNPVFENKSYTNAELLQSHGVFETHSVTKSESAVLRSQENRFNELIQKAPTSSELKQDFLQEGRRISQLSTNEQQQIANDYEYSLDVAAGTPGT